MNVWKPTSENEIQDVIDDVPITYTEYKRSPNPFFADYLGGGLGSVTLTLTNPCIGISSFILSHNNSQRLTEWRI